MIWLVWVLIALLCAAVWSAIRFYDRIEQLEGKLDASRSRSQGLRVECDYWIGQTDNWRRRYEVASSGLSKVQAIGTDNMANIGKRMSAIAVRANAAAKSLPFDKA